MKLETFIMMIENDTEKMAMMRAVMPENFLSFTHDRKGIKIEDTDGVFGILRSIDGKWRISDGGSLMASITNDGDFVPNEILEQSAYIHENLPDGIVFAPTEFMMPLKTVFFDFEDLLEYWGKYHQAYDFVRSLSSRHA